MKLKKLKLTAFNEQELFEREMRGLRGGGTPGNCRCGCSNDNTNANSSANHENGYGTSAGFGDGEHNDDCSCADNFSNYTDFWYSSGVHCGTGTPSA